jgi:hypothetical protein
MIPGLPIEQGPLTEGWANLRSLAAERFDIAEAYFALCQRLYPGLDRRGQAAFLIGGVSYYAAAVQAWFELRGEPAPSLDHLGLRINAAADGLAYRWSAPQEADGAAALEAALLPLVHRLRAETRIGERAQWRLVADSIAAAYQEIGQSIGCAPQARERALAAIADGRTSNPQTGYHCIGTETGERYYLKRGGCCRWYTADAGSYCATCVMRRP